MLAVDFVGLLLTVCLVGLRYPHYALGAAAIHDAGRLLLALLSNGRIESVIAAGAFGHATVGGLQAGFAPLAVALGGPLANYLVSAGLGGFEREPTAHLLHPAAAVRKPFAVVNMRLALLSTVVTLWQFILSGV